MTKVPIKANGMVRDWEGKKRGRDLCLVNVVVGLVVGDLVGLDWIGLVSTNLIGGCLGVLDLTHGRRVSWWCHTWAVRCPKGT